MALPSEPAKPNNSTSAACDEINAANTAPKIVCRSRTSNRIQSDKFAPTTLQSGIYRLAPQGLGTQGMALPRTRPSSLSNKPDTGHFQRLSDGFGAPKLRKRG